MLKMAAKVGVIGGGIIGLSTAVTLLESGLNVNVTVIADQFSPHTTGDGSAGFWYPYLLGDVPDEELHSWCRQTFDFLLNLNLSPIGPDVGVSLVSAYLLHEKEEKVPVFSDIFINFRKLNQKELQHFDSAFASGFFVTTLYAECTKLLPYLLKRFQERGGKVLTRKVETIAELIPDYDVIVNCSGLESARLVQDKEVYPIRGQVRRVKAPWVKHGVMGGEHYILPNSEVITLGGTHQEGNWSRDLNSIDGQFILKGCHQLVKSLKSAVTIQEWVGLRPGRSCPRIDAETLSAGSKSSLVVHNYGHGGSGVTVFWGCARQVLSLLKENWSKLSPTTIRSRL